MIDSLDGREIELTPIWAEPLRRATALGVPMPHTADLLHRIRNRIDARNAWCLPTARPSG